MVQGTKQIYTFKKQNKLLGIATNLTKNIKMGIFIKFYEDYKK